MHIKYPAEKRLTQEEMQALVNLSLFHISGNKAMPNFAYCRPDMPPYEQTEVDGVLVWLPSEKSTRKGDK